MEPIGSLLILIAGLIAATILVVRWKHYTRWNTWLELCLIGLWAMWVGREYLNLNPALWPGIGLFSRTIDEFSSAIQPHFVWSLLPRCGTCVLWNGSVNGGSPAFADVYGATLHPIVIVTTLLFGAINGAKITLIASFFLAGLAQWWLARVMHLGRIARLWSSAMAVVGGQLAGRMEIGIVTLVLSTASCALIIAPGIDLALTGRRHAAILFGISLALALTSGQGYLQIGMLIGLLPAFAVFTFDRRWRTKPIGKEFALAGLIAILLSAILWIPTLHFWPNLVKDTDPTFSSAQPIQYAVMNLVVNDPEFYLDTSWGKLAVPHLYINYIGWIPIALAIGAVVTTLRSNRRVLAFFLIAIALIYLAASATTLRLLSIVLPDVMAAVRYPSLIAGLAAPLILGMAAWGLDRWLQSSWLARMMRQRTTRIVLSIGMAVPLVASIHSAYVFGQVWLTTRNVPSSAYHVIGSIDRSATQWIGVPFGEHVWTAVGLADDLKLTNVFRPWQWKDRTPPPAAIEVTYDPAKTSVDNRFATTEGIILVAHPDQAYARIESGAQHIPCQAIALGGDIDVDCHSDVDGTLIVRENNWSGWFAVQDGQPIDVLSAQWLSVPAPAGQHHYEFRYRPWDVAAGLLLSVIGLGLIITMTRRARHRVL